jgi:hypothetical protein
MFPKLDYLFNIGLVVCLAYVFLFVCNAFFRFAVISLGV